MDVSPQAAPFLGRFNFAGMRSGFHGAPAVVNSGGSDMAGRGGSVSLSAQTHPVRLPGAVERGGSPPSHGGAPFQLLLPKSTTQPEEVFMGSTENNSD